MVSDTTRVGASARSWALPHALTVRTVLSAVVALSFVVRSAAAMRHVAPRYFPDEYLYTALARSLGSGGTPAIRGQTAHFPALLEPLLAAPFQALFSPETAYRLTQMENALAMSLAAIPVYLLARRVSLSEGYALVCALFAIAISDLVYAGYTLGDPIAYPLALGAVAAGVSALDRPTRRMQMSFLGLALLATFARLQFAVLPLAFVAAALVVDRRRALRTQTLPLVLLGLAAAATLAAGPGRLLGYYGHVARITSGAEFVNWSATDVFLLALGAGAVIVPGALVALARPRGRTETAFAALGGVLAAGLLFEAALYASNGVVRFQERYLFVLLPLAPIAFGLYLKHGRPAPRAVVVLASVLFVAAARLPLSAYSAGVGRTDSPLLFAEHQLEQHVGTANGALVVSLLTAVAALAAVAVAFRGGGRLALAAALGVAVATSIGATVYDVGSSRHVRATDVASYPSWVDEARIGDVTIVQTPNAPPQRAVQQLFWNRSITNEVVLGTAEPTDFYLPQQHLDVGPTGVVAGAHGNLLWQGFGATAQFANARLAARAGTFSLWAIDGAPQLELLEVGRSSDGWLAGNGTLTVWPSGGGGVHGTLRFTVSVPDGVRPTWVRFGSRRFLVTAGRPVVASWRIDAPGPWSASFTAGTHLRLADGRLTGARSSAPLFTPGGSSPTALATLASWTSGRPSTSGASPARMQSSPRALRS